MSKSKNVLIVYAHQDPASFNGALCESAKETLQKAGHVVQVSDLYARNFEPRAQKKDIPGGNFDVPFNYCDEIRKGVDNQTLADDIAKEMEKVRTADLVVFQFPLYYSSVPAILKGWFDRILVDGFAVDFSQNKILNEGLMKGKKAILSVTTGGSSQMLSPFGIFGDINTLLLPVQYGTLYYCGFDVLAPQISYATSFVDQKQREEYLQEWTFRLSEIFEEKPLNFPKLSDFDVDGDFVLHQSICDRCEYTGTVPTTAHHLDKLASSSQPDDQCDENSNYCIPMGTQMCIY